ncbi:MAG: hypothetical protein Ta2G_08430 [Termitinemataceae bacterium]|nr:MAG: hypothetical protein Ta2G_08430 [Termitinemataceae bacterium]
MKNYLWNFITMLRMKKSKKHRLVKKTELLNDHYTVINSGKRSKAILTTQGDLNFQRTILRVQKSTEAAKEVVPLDGYLKISDLEFKDLIGSGPIESANKVVVQMRCKQSGMHWKSENAQKMLNLTSKWESGLWEPLVPQLLAAA